MNILLLTPWYPDELRPNHGIFIRDQATVLSRRHNIHVLSSKVDYNRFGICSSQLKVSSEQGFAETRLVVSRSLPLFNQFYYFWRTLKVARKICREFSPDIIYSNIGFPGAFWGWCLSRMTGIPWLLSEHTLLHNNFRSIFHRWLTLPFVQRADAVVTVSKHSASIIHAYTGKQAFVVPNLIRFDLFRGIHEAPALPVQIGFLGSSFFQKKGLDLLLRSLAGLSGDFILHIGGNDPEEASYRQLATELGLGNRCIWHGRVTRDQVPAFMARLHFFVSASRFESFGMAIAEAMACGLPVVSTDSGGPADFVRSDNGILVSNHNQAALSAAMGRMITDWKSYDRMKIRESVLNAFSEQVIGRLLNDFLEGLMDMPAALH